MNKSYSVCHNIILQEFFLTVKDALRSGYEEGCGGVWGPEEQQLASKLSSVKEQVHAALCGKAKINIEITPAF